MVDKSYMNMEQWLRETDSARVPLRLRIIPHGLALSGRNRASRGERSTISRLVHGTAPGF